MCLGYFLLDKDEKLIIADKNVINFARRDKENVEWHGAGSVRANDLIIHIRKNVGNPEYTVNISKHDSSNASPFDKSFNLQLSG